MVGFTPIICESFTLKVKMYMNNNKSMVIGKDYMRFVENVFQMVKQKMGDEYIVSIHQARKNNDTTRWGISIGKKKESAEFVSFMPTIYLEELYYNYTHGRELSDIVKSVITIYQEVQEPYMLTEDDFSFEKLKDRICFMLVNNKLNRENLNIRPHRTFLDLSVVYYVLFDRDEKGTATIPINYNLMEKWEVDEETLWSHANINTRAILTPTLKTMRDTIHELTGRIYESNPEVELYVLSNSYREFGAVSVLFEESMRCAACILDSNFFIIPSSIHEVILCADNQNVDKEMINECIRDINQTQLEEAEVLSEHVYYYDREQNKISYEI